MKLAVSKKKAQSTVSYTKEQILASKKYKKQRDLVDSLLMDGEHYTMEEVNKKVSDFMKGRVK